MIGMTMKEYCSRDGVSYHTAVKRRQALDVGTLIPPRTWVLSEREWARLRREMEIHRRKP